MLSVINQDYLQKKIVLTVHICANTQSFYFELSGQIHFIYYKKQNTELSFFKSLYFYFFKFNVLYCHDT